MSYKHHEIPKGWFKLRNGNKAYITYSTYGHYPGKKGEKIIKEIKKINPDYLLVEAHPEKNNDLLIAKDEYKKAIKIIPEKRLDVHWAIIVGYETRASVIKFDVPAKKFLSDIYRSFSKYSKKLATLNVVAHVVCIRIWHSKKRKEELDMKRIYEDSKKYLLKFAPKEVKSTVRKKGVEKLFMEWMDLVDINFKELDEMNGNYLSYLMHIFIRFPTRKKRDIHMIKMVERFSKKGKTSVVVGSSHVKEWIKNGYIKKL